MQEVETAVTDQTDIILRGDTQQSGDVQGSKTY